MELLRLRASARSARALGGSLAYAAFAVWLFEQGLHRYASGNRFTARG